MPTPIEECDHTFYNGLCASCGIRIVVGGGDSFDTDLLDMPDDPIDMSDPMEVAAEAEAQRRLNERMARAFEMNMQATARVYPTIVRAHPTVAVYKDEEGQ